MTSFRSRLRSSPLPPRPRSAWALVLLLSACGGAQESTLDELNPPQAAATAPPATRMVDGVNGNDASSGAPTAPWRTIAKAARTAAPGDVVYIRGGTYRERIQVQVSGSDTAGYITFMSAPGEKAVVAGDPSFGGTPLLLVRERHHLKFVGLSFTSYETTSTAPIGVWIAAGSHHVLLDGVRITQINRPGAGALPLVVNSDDVSKPTYGITIQNGEIGNSACAPYQAVSIVGNVTDFVLEANWVHDLDCIAVDVMGNYGTIIPKPPPSGYVYDASKDRARNGVVRRNSISFVKGTALYVDGGQDTLIERNTIHDVNAGIVIAAEIHANDGIGTVPSSSTVMASGITVRNNVVYDVSKGTSWAPAFAIGAWSSNYGPVKNCKVTNNTFASTVAPVQINPQTSGLVFQNNSVTATSNGAISSFAPGTNTANTFGYNGWWAPAGGFYIYDSRSWSAPPTFETHSVRGNPLVLDAAGGDFRLQASSPLIDRGNLSVVSAGELDRAGSPRVSGAAVNIGSYE